MFKTIYKTGKIFVKNNTEFLEDEIILDQIDDVTKYISNKFNQPFENVTDINADPQIDSFNKCIEEGLLSKELQRKASEIRQQSYTFKDIPFEHNGEIL